MLYATLGMGRFPNHGNRIPRISDGRFNPARDSGVVGISDTNSATLPLVPPLTMLVLPLGMAGRLLV